MDCRLFCAVWRELLKSVVTVELIWLLEMVKIHQSRELFVCLKEA